MEITFNDGGFGKRINRLNSGLVGELKETIQRMATEVENRSMKETPVDTGTLKKSIGRDVKFGGLEVVVQPNTKYAVPVHEGVSYRRRLKGGKRRRTMRKGNPYMTRGYRRALPAVYREMKNFFKKIYK